MRDYKVARNNDEVVIWAYFEQGGLEKSEVTHLAHHIAGETLLFHDHGRTFY